MPGYEHNYAQMGALPSTRILQGEDACARPCGSLGAARAGFRITIFDERTRGDNSEPRLERVAAGGGGDRGCLNTLHLFEA